MKKLMKKSVLLMCLAISLHLWLSQVTYAAMLSDVTLGDTVSINDRLALVDGVALGDGFSLVDGGEGAKFWDLVTVRPMFRLQQMYDSNVFLAENDEKDDFITSFDAGAEAEMKMGDVLVKGGYVFNMNLFAEHDDQNSYNHTVIGKIDWQLTDYEVIIRDKYRRFSNRAGTEDTDRISRQKNVLSADAIAEYNRLTFDLGYDFIIEDYLSNDYVSGTTTYDESEDRVEHIFREETSYRFLPKTSFLGEVDLGFIEYSNQFNSDSWFIQTLVGLKGEVLKDAVSSIKVGLRVQEYDDRGNRDFIGVVARSSTSKKFGVKDTVTLSTERSVYESTYSNMNYYTLTHVGLGWIHQFNDKLSSHAAGAYQYNRYPNKTLDNRGVLATRYDNIYKVACGLRYDIRQWLSSGVAYQFQQKESRFANYDYIDHLISASLTAQF